MQATVCTPDTSATTFQQLGAELEKRALLLVTLLLPGDRLIKSASEEFVRKDPSDSRRSSLVGTQEYTGLLKLYYINLTKTICTLNAQIRPS